MFRARAPLLPGFASRSILPATRVRHRRRRRRPGGSRDKPRALPSRARARRAGAGPGRPELARTLGELLSRHAELEHAAPRPAVRRRGSGRVRPARRHRRVPRALRGAFRAPGAGGRGRQLAGARRRRLSPADLGRARSSAHRCPDDRRVPAATPAGGPSTLPPASSRSTSRATATPRRCPMGPCSSWAAASPAVRSRRSSRRRAGTSTSPAAALPWLPAGPATMTSSGGSTRPGSSTQTVESLPEPSARLWANVLATGRRGGHDLHLRTLQRARRRAARALPRGGRESARFAPDLHESVAWGDDRYRS